MAQHRLSARVDLSIAAERRFLKACKVQGGQTLFIEEAIEFYVRESDVLEKLESIERVLLQRIDLGEGKVLRQSADTHSSETIPEQIADQSSMDNPITENVIIKQPDLTEESSIHQQEGLRNTGENEKLTSNGLEEAMFNTLRSLIGEDAF